MKFQSTVPVLYSLDIERSFDYYTRVLGFEKKWDWGNPADFGCVSADYVEIFICLNNQPHPGSMLCINLDNVDEYYELIKDKGANVLSLPGNKEWNMREMVIADPDGNILRFGHLIECE